MRSQLARRIVIGLLDLGSLDLNRIRRNVNASTLAFGNNGHKLGTHSAGLGLFFNVLEIYRRPAVYAGRAATVHRAVLRRLAGRNIEAHLTALAMRLDVPFLSLLLGEVERAHEDRLVPAGRVGALDGTRPQPRDDGRLAAALLGRHPHFGVHVPDALDGLLLHPGAIVLNIGS